MMTSIMDTDMKTRILLLTVSVLFNMQADAARGRQPCSGSKGGIAHCTSDGRFVCNDGSLSQSKRFCSGYGASELPRQVKPSPSARKAQTKKRIAVKGQEQRVVENNAQFDTQPRQPTCAPLYMANKPGFTHLPICSGNQYSSASANVLCLLFELIRRLQVETHLNALGDLLQRMALKHAVRTFRIRGELTAWLAFMFSA